MNSKKTEFRKLLADLFDVYKHERKGLLGFTFLVLLIIGFNYSLDYWVKAPHIDTTQLDSLIRVNNQKPARNGEVNTPYAIEINTATSSDWAQLGFSKKQAKAILNFKRAIGGSFQSIEELKAAYVIDSAKFLKIQPYLELEQSNISEVELGSSKIEKEEGKRSMSTKALFYFDPNSISVDSLLLLGFSRNLAQSFINYREKVRGFKEPDDVLKLYLYDESLHEIYKPFIKIEPHGKHDSSQIDRVKSENRYQKNIGSNQLIEINSADTAHLISLYGIGPYYASIIIQYRNQLGGFYRFDQLYEIKYLPEETLKGIKNNIVIDTSQINKIAINHCEFNDLLAHPYFDYYETKLLFTYKNEQGKFISLRDFKKAGPLPDSFLKKVKHYMKFN